jgi:transketolase
MTSLPPTSRPLEPVLESLFSAYSESLGRLGQEDSRVRAVESQDAEPRLGGGLGEHYPDRVSRLAAGGAPDLLSRAVALAKEGPTFVHTTALAAVGESYRFLRDSICYPRIAVKIVASYGAFPPNADAPAVVEDLGLMRGLPGMTVVVPADAATTRTMVPVLARWPGPAYVRLADGSWPTVTDGSFAIGKAIERRPGADLTIVAVGSPLARALASAEELGRVGISARVLDFASVKPFDEPALLRAARDTGAILVIEEHSVVTGVGAMVAATTAENYPVPVRRVGIPDLFLDPDGGTDPLARYGLSAERIRDEAWELLRIRGKVQ